MWLVFLKTQSLVVLTLLLLAFTPVLYYIIRGVPHILYELDKTFRKSNGNSDIARCCFRIS